MAAEQQPDRMESFKEFMKAQRAPGDRLNEDYPNQPMTRAQLEAARDEAYRNYQTADDPEDRKAYRNIALRYQRQIDKLGSAPEQPNNEPADDTADHPTLDELYAYFAQHPIRSHEGKGGRVIDPASLSPEVLQQIYELEAQANDQLGGDDPWEEIDAHNARPGPTPEQMAKLEQLEQERERVRNEREAKRKAEKEQDKAERAAEKEQARADREARELARRDFVAQQQIARAQAKDDQARQDAERKAAVAAAARQKIINDAWLKTGQMVTQTGVRVAALPQPGGIGLLLVTILVIVFALVPMNSSGDTRLMLIWLAIRGKVQLPTSGKTDLSAGGMDSGGSLLQKAVQAAGQAAQGAANAAGSAISQATTGGTSQAHADTTALELGLQATTGIPFPVVIPLAAGETTIQIPFASLGGG